jgi:hypothetical protein
MIKDSNLSFNIIAESITSSNKYAVVVRGHSNSAHAWIGGEEGQVKACKSVH